MRGREGIMRGRRNGGACQRGRAFVSNTKLRLAGPATERKIGEVKRKPGFRRPV